MALLDCREGEGLDMLGAGLVMVGAGVVMLGLYLEEVLK
jgi:hypothetical protein